MTSARGHRTFTRRATLGGTLAAAGIALAGRNVAEADEGGGRRLRPFRRHVNGVVLSGRHRTAAPGRPTLVFLHGWLENQHQFDRQLPSVRPGDGILVYDLRDQGDSSATGAPYLFGALVEDLAALLAAFKVERPVLVGQSLGGQIVMQYAIDCPGSLAGLVVANAAPPSEQDRTADGLAERLREPGIWQKGLPVFRGLYFSADFVTRDPETVATWDGWYLANDPDAAATLLVAYSYRPDPTIATGYGSQPRNALSMIDVPTLVVGADADALITPEQLAQLDAIPGRDRVILSGGHAINLERPTEFNQSLRDWLDTRVD